MGNLDCAGGVAVFTVTNIEAEATPYSGDHRIRTRGAIRVKVTRLIEVIGHAVAASRHEPRLPGGKLFGNVRFPPIADLEHSYSAAASLLLGLRPLGLTLRTSAMSQQQTNQFFARGHLGSSDLHPPYNLTLG